MEIVDKIVDFKKYCETCKHKDTKEVKDPCNECLDNPVNSHTTKPVKYEEIEEDNKNETDV